MSFTAVILATASLAFSQPGTGAGRQPGRGTTQGLGDTDPLAKDLGSNSEANTGQGFGTVYELPRRRGMPRRFARVDGAVVAVFPYSTYEWTPFGEVATLPPGTVYYVGANWLSRLMAPVHATATPGLLEVATSVDLLTDPSTTSEVDLRAKPDAGAPTPHADSIWTSETYRRQRLRALLSN